VKEGSDAAKPEEGQEAESPRDSRRRHGKKAHTADAGVQTITCERISVAAAVGEKAGVEVPMTEQVWARRRYEASFDPPRPELSVSSDKGWIEPGVAEMPFVVFFEPQREGTVESTLVVSLGNLELRTPVVASTGHEVKRHRRHLQ
jgi:hypothetical protein